MENRRDATTTVNKNDHNMYTSIQVNIMKKRVHSIIILFTTLMVVYLHVYSYPPAYPKWK